MRNRRNRLWLLVLVAVVWLAPATLAQTENEEDDWAEQDRRYQERLQRQREAQTPVAPTPAPGAEVDPGERERMIEEFVAMANDLIKDRNYSSRSSDTYLLKTDDPRVDLGAALELLDSFRTWFVSFWDGRAELTPYDGPGRMYLFYSFFKYNQLLTGDARLSDFRPPGHYRGNLDAVVLYTDGAPPGDLQDILVHEAAHQLVENMLFVRDEAQTSPWIEEGLGTYFGHTLRGRDGTFVTGKVGGKGVEIVRGGGTKDGSGKARLKDARKAMSGETSWSAHDVVEIRDPQRFYSEGANARYGIAWVLVHFLFHGDDGAHADAFVRYLGLEANGEGGPERFYETIGMDADTLDARFERYFSKFKSG